MADDTLSSSGDRGELDEFFDALANRHRRRLLVALREANPQPEFEVPEDVHDDPATFEELRTEHVHVHLPKLAELGVIDWDREANLVRKGPRFEELEPVLEAMEDRADVLPIDWP